MRTSVLALWLLVLSIDLYNATQQRMSYSHIDRYLEYYTTMYCSDCHVSKSSVLQAILLLHAVCTSSGYTHLSPKLRKASELKVAYSGATSIAL
jgi:hypothetical protein